MTTVAPNPTSPYSDAEPGLRHLFAVPAFLEATPRPGALAPTGCNRLAVVPDTVAEAPALDQLPDGLCPTCIATMHADELPADERPTTECHRCGGITRHQGLCALCRQDLHDNWWPRHDDAQPKEA